MRDDTGGSPEYLAAVVENERACRRVLRPTQIDLIDSFSREYLLSGRLESLADRWGMCVERDMHFILMAADIRSDLIQLAAERLVLTWGERYVLIVKEREARIRSAERTVEDDPVPPGGHLYVLSNPCLPGLLKIGMTTCEPSVRVKQLSWSTSIPEPFEIVASFACADPRACERIAHDSLAKHRKPGKEFFAVSREIAIDACRKAVEDRQ